MMITEGQAQVRLALFLFLKINQMKKEQLKRGNEIIAEIEATEKLLSHYRSSTSVNFINRSESLNHTGKIFHSINNPSMYKRSLTMTFDFSSSKDGEFDLSEQILIAQLKSCKDAVVDFLSTRLERLRHEFKNL